MLGRCEIGGTKCRVILLNYIKSQCDALRVGHGAARDLCGGKSSRVRKYSVVHTKSLFPQEVSTIKAQTYM